MFLRLTGGALLSCSKTLCDRACYTVIHLIIDQFQQRASCAIFITVGFRVRFRLSATTHRARKEDAYIPL